MSISRCLLGTLALLLALAAPASSHTIVITGLFAPEGGPGATGTGDATITVDTDIFSMRVQANFSGLSGNTTAAHIHCCQAVQGSGNVGVATMLPSFAGFPLGVTSGSYDQTFDMNLAASWNPAFVTAQGGINGAFNALVNAMSTDFAYFNIHSSTFPGGEIRAHLFAVPEPGTLALLGMGFAGIGVSRRRMRVRNA
jgi:hypothetical protein